MSEHEKPGKAHTGGCLCGAVRYRINDEMHSVINCHCSQCRKTHGHFGAYSAADEKAVTFIEDKGLKWFQSSETAKRGFCTECGASLFYNNQNRDYISIAAGSLDTPTKLQSTANIFTDDKGDYYEISDRLPRHKQGRS